MSSATSMSSAEFATPAVAFMFDVDGVLIRSHELQAQALHATLQEAVSNHCPEALIPSQEQIIEVLVGGTEAAAIASIFTLVPQLSAHMMAVIRDAWQRYFELLDQYRDEVGIKSSITLLRTLHDLGHLICLVSNSKRSDILHYCKLLSLDFVCEDSTKMVSVESVTAAKPSPQSYLQAAVQLGIDPERCIVFEDSVNGVKAGHQAGMYVIGLQSTYVSPEALFHVGANEVVANLLHSKQIVAHALTPGRLLETVGGFHVRVFTIKDLTDLQLNQIVAQTFAVYNQTFAGRDVTTWRQKICDPRDLCTRLGLVCTTAGSVVGYAVYKLRSIMYKRQTRLLVLASAGTLNSGRSSGLIVQFYQREIRRSLLAHPEATIHMVDNFLSYGGYTVARRSLRTIYPSETVPRVPRLEYEYMLAISNSLGYKKADVEDEQIYLSASHLQTDVSTPRTNDAVQQFFESRVRNVQGHGLYSIGAIEFANLQPMLELVVPLSRM